MNEVYNQNVTIDSIESCRYIEHDEDWMVASINSGKELKRNVQIGGLSLSFSSTNQPVHRLVTWEYFSSLQVVDGLPYDVLEV